MTRLALNREFAVRHLGVALLMLALSGWFAYDGFIGYPRQDEAFFEVRHLKKATAVERQKEFAALALLAALLVGGHLLCIARFSCSFDDESFTVGGVKRRFADIGKIDRSRWEKKGIIVLDGIKLDAWHHTGVNELVKRLDAARLRHLHDGGQLL